MVAPADIAQLAATLLIQNDKAANPNYITGPQDYSPNNVAAAFADALRTPVQAVQIKPDEWLSFLMKLGFSKESANSLANMTKVTLAQDFERPASPNRGTTTLHQYITALVENRRK